MQVQTIYKHKQCHRALAEAQAPKFMAKTMKTFIAASLLSSFSLGTAHNYVYNMYKSL